MEPDTALEKPMRLPTRQIIHLSIQLLGLAILLVWSFRILSPFVTPIVWAMLLAVTLYPAYKKVKKWFGNRGALAATLMSLVLLALLIVPSLWIASKTSDEIRNKVDSWRAGQITLPTPSQKVTSWPLIGPKIYNIWNQASLGVDSLLAKHPEETKAAAAAGLGLLVSFGKGLLLFALAIIVCGIFLSYSEQAEQGLHRFFDRLLDAKQLDVTSISALTIRSVVKGILLVSVIQSALAAVGFFVAGFPAPGIWVFACLIFSLIQVGILPVGLVAIIYIWSSATTTTALLFTLYFIPINFLDNILKPILLGRSAPVPSLVVFLGSLGGFIAFGFVGLFTGPVILSLGYSLFDRWLESPSST